MTLFGTIYLLYCKLSNRMRQSKGNSNNMYYHNHIILFFCEKTFLIKVTKKIKASYYSIHSMYWCTYVYVYKKNSRKKLSLTKFSESVAQLFSRGLVKVHWVQVVLLKFFETVFDAQIHFFKRSNINIK